MQSIWLACKAKYLSRNGVLPEDLCTKLINELELLALPYFTEQARPHYEVIGIVYHDSTIDPHEGMKLFVCLWERYRPFHIMWSN
jgi:hypothetical protein